MPKTSWPTSEKQLLAPLTPWLTARGCTVYPEVTFTDYDSAPVADLVTLSTQGQVSVFEAKTSLSVRLIRQAYWWTDYADAANIVLPVAKAKNNIEERQKCYPILRALGLGLIEITAQNPSQPEIQIILNPIIQSLSLPGRSDKLKSILCPQHQQLGKPGTNKAEKFTPYQVTLNNLITYVNQNPGTTIKAAVGQIEHHWDSRTQAINRLVKIARDSGFKQLKQKLNGGQITLWPMK